MVKNWKDKPRSEVRVNRNIYGSHSTASERLIKEDLSTVLNIYGITDDQAVPSICLPSTTLSK